MNHNPFETIANWLTRHTMTTDEKQRIKNTLVSYMTTHPVKSGLFSPYMFRYASIALATLLIVLGGTIGISSAASNALPNQKLYAVKLWVEEFQANNQDTPADKIAFETKRIETRFDEATKLAINQELDEATSAILQSGLEHSRTIIRDTADFIQETDPKLALSATNVLETTFSSNGKILASIEKNTGQNIGTIVLAAEVTTKTLALEKVKFEKLVALQPNEVTKKSTEVKLLALELRLAEQTTITQKKETAVEPEPQIGLMAMKTSLMLEEKSIDLEDPHALIAAAKKKIAEGLYSEASVLLQKVEQLLDEEKLLKSLEETYQVTTEKEITPEPIEVILPEEEPEEESVDANPLPLKETSQSIESSIAKKIQ